MARTPLNTWLDGLRALASAEGIDVPHNIERKVKKSGVWQRVTPLQYFEEAKSRVPQVEADLKSKREREIALSNNSKTTLSAS